MNLGNVHSKNKLYKTIRWFLHINGMAIFFLILSAVTSIESISAIIPSPKFSQQEILQSPNSDWSEKEFPFLVGIEAEEIEESKEDKKDGSSDKFSFNLSTSFLAKAHYTLEEEGFFSADCIASFLKVPLYLLFQNLRLHLS